MGPAGLEPSDITDESNTGLRNEARKGGALSGAKKASFGDFDADLRKVIEAWPTLPEAVRQDILAMVEASQVRK